MIISAPFFNYILYISNSLFILLSIENFIVWVNLLDYAKFIYIFYFKYLLWNKQANHSILICNNDAIIPVSPLNLIFSDFFFSILLKYSFADLKSSCINKNLPLWNSFNALLISIFLYKLFSDIPRYFFWLSDKVEKNSNAYFAAESKPTSSLSVACFSCTL